MNRTQVLTSVSDSFDEKEKMEVGGNTYFSAGHLTHVAASGSAAACNPDRRSEPAIPVDSSERLEAETFAAFHEKIAHLQRELDLALNNPKNGPDTPLFTEDNDVVNFEDVFKGTYKNDTQYDALGGNDVINLGVNKQDQIQAGLDLGLDSGNAFSGGDGNDVILGSSAEEILIGDAGNDIIVGGDDRNGLIGGAGNDIITGGGGNDSIDGDRLLIEGGDDYLAGETGNDHIQGGGGNDIIFGGFGNDTLCGDYLTDYLEGFDHDTNTNKLYGGEGNDNILGGNGHDLMVGGNGDDELNASWNKEAPTPGNGTDTMYGNEGADTFYFSNRSVSDTLDAADVIGDFEDNVDKIYFEKTGVTYGDLVIKDVGQDCVIYLAETQQIIVKVLNSAGQISYDDIGLLAG